MAELGYDVGHVLVGSWAIAPSSSLAPIVTQRTIFASYDHLADVVGGSSATANPLNEHWMADCTIIYSLTWIYKGQQGAPIIFPVQSQCKVRAMSKRVLTLPSRSLTWRRKVGMKRLCGKGAFLLSQKIFSKRCSFLCTFSKPVKVGCSKSRKISAGF